MSSKHSLTRLPPLKLMKLFKRMSVSLLSRGLMLTEKPSLLQASPACLFHHCEDADPAKGTSFLPAPLSISFSNDHSQRTLSRAAVLCFLLFSFVVLKLEIKVLYILGNLPLSYISSLKQTLNKQNKSHHFAIFKFSWLANDTNSYSESKSSPANTTPPRALTECSVVTTLADRSAFPGYQVSKKPWTNGGGAYGAYQSEYWPPVLVTGSWL